MRKIESLLPVQYRELSAARIRRGLVRPFRHWWLWWRHRYDGRPNVLANSFPKSGTFLLGRCFELSGLFDDFNLGVYIYGLESPRFGLRKQRAMLARLGGGIYVQAHLSHSPEAAALLQSLDYKHVLIIRDPRDVVVSLVRFEMSHRYLSRHDYFSSLPDDETRLTAAIQGTGRPGAQDIGERTRDYVRWQSTDCCVVRYERLVGSAGGGDPAAQRAEVRRIFEHVGVGRTDDQIAEIADNLYSREARTFRKGAIHDWPNHFTPEHKEMFKTCAGDLLIDMGYERDYDW